MQENYKANQQLKTENNEWVTLYASAEIIIINFTMQHFEND